MEQRRPGRKEIQERRNEMKSMDDAGTGGKCPHELIILRIPTHARTEHGSLMLLLFIPASWYVRLSIRELVMTRYHDRYQARGKEVMTIYGFSGIHSVVQDDADSFRILLPSGA